MCQFCGLPNNHEDDLELLRTATLLAWTSTITVGAWWWASVTFFKPAPAYPTMQTDQKNDGFKIDAP